MMSNQNAEILLWSVICTVQGDLCKPDPMGLKIYHCLMSSHCDGMITVRHVFVMGLLKVILDMYDDK